MPTVQCLHHGCRRQVSEDSPWGYYCHDHRRESTMYSEMMADQVSALTDGQRMPTLSLPREVDSYADMVDLHTPLDPELSQPLARAVDKWNASRDMTIPQEASGAKSSAPGEFRELLLEEGVEPHRISSMRVTGMNRLVPGTSVIQRADSLSHEVLVLDRGQETECVIDPSISMFAPVYNQDQSVEDQLRSGETPYGETPWIGETASYTDGDVIWWDRREYREWQ